MIHARHLANLSLSAASGLVVDGDTLWVVADDLPALHRYDLGGALLERVALAGAAPAAADAPLPKAQKPDLEALAGLPDGALLALGSGSRPQRRGGFLRRSAGGIVAIDLSPLYTRLEAELPALNIEGAVVRDDRLILAHRGAGGRSSALIGLDLATVQADLAGGVLGAGGLRTLRAVDLGSLAGAPLGLTDLALHPDGSLWFSAAAEATDDAYEDGAIRGSILGRFDAQGAVDWREPVMPVCKIEGLHWWAGSWLAVTDADDPQRPAALLELRLDA